MPTWPVLRVFADTVERLASALKRGGHGGDEEADGEDELSRDNPVMAALYAAAVQGRIATGAEAGLRTARLGNAALAVDPVDSFPRHLDSVDPREAAAVLAELAGNA